MQVMDNKLFSIEPRRGKLLAGECHTVTLTYRYLYIKHSVTIYITVYAGKLSHIFTLIIIK